MLKLYPVKIKCGLRRMPEGEVSVEAIPSED